MLTHETYLLVYIWMFYLSVGALLPLSQMLELRVGASELLSTKGIKQ